MMIMMHDLLPLFGEGIAAFPAFPLFVRSAKPREASAPWRETRCLNGWPRNWRKNGWNWILGKQFSEIQMTIG